MAVMDDVDRMILDLLKPVADVWSSIRGGADGEVLRKDEAYLALYHLQAALSVEGRRVYENIGGK